jgi:hypothetical protein
MWRVSRPAVVLPVSLLAGLLIVMTSPMQLARARTGKNKAMPVVLAAGHSGRFRWSASVVGDRGRNGGQRPCLIDEIIDLKEAGDPTTFSPQRSLKICGPLPAVTESPEIVNVSMGEGPQMLTVFAVATVPAVATVVADFAAGKARTFHLKTLNGVQRAKAGVGVMHYVGFEVRGNSCLLHVTALNEKGNVVYDGPTGACPG